MANSSNLLLHCLGLFLIFSFNLSGIAADGDRKLHIVYMGSLRKEESYLPSSHHLSFLQQVITSSSAENLLVQSYGRSFNGFAAMLSDSEAKQLEGSNEVVSVFPSMTYELHTTRSWSFLGMEETTPHQNPTAGSHLIMGVLDTGIWPESESFNDEGFGPPPKKWKGTCKGGQNFTCNKKLIGARYYGLESTTARDANGHGTHTASTAAGRSVKDASFFGLANGTARGGVPSARIAAYNVCPSGCEGAYILAGFDDAIADGVDIITISVGPDSPLDYTSDVIAIGAFHAMEKGILTCNSAGNNGPLLGMSSSVAPWILSVAAGSTDRRFIDKVVLGTGKELIGNSVNSFDLKGKSFPLINGSDARIASCSEETSWCFDKCLNSSLVKGKIVVCDDVEGGDEAKRAGAVGAILTGSDQEDTSYTWPLPALVLNDERFGILGSYMKSSRRPVAKILKSETIKNSNAPLVASFSSRGPNEIVRDLLKPDIVAPGVEILAAYPPIVPPTLNPQDERRFKFNVISGTSMACPHAAAIAAYVKTFHPKWSPSAIKSAIMTTAIPMNATANSGAEFGYGSGGINPLGAIHPGLVYDAQKTDYIIFLCSIGYNETRIRAISGDNSTSCSQGDKKVSPKDFNYPSMTVEIRTNQSFAVSFTRTVTNVGIARSTYKAQVSTTLKLKVEVVPNVLAFKSINEKKSFNVTVSGRGLSSTDKIMTASLVWNDGRHNVRSPIVIDRYGTLSGEV